jgi:carbon-monoxide dehydrogenase medium subunit
VHGAFAIVGVAALVALGRDGAVTRASLALCGVGGAPYTAAWLESAVAGRALDRAALAEVADRVRDEIEPFSDGQGRSEHRKHLAGVLTRRALEAAVERAEVA